MHIKSLILKIKKQEIWNFKLKSEIHNKIVNCEENILTEINEKSIKKLKKNSLPEITFGQWEEKKDTIIYTYFRDAIPRVNNFKILKYNYKIESNSKIDSLLLKSDRFTNEFKDRLNKLRNNDIIEIKNMIVTNDKNKIFRIKNKKAIVVKE